LAPHEDSPAAVAEPATGGAEGGRAAASIRRWTGWWIAHPTIAAAAIYAVLSLVLVGQGLLPGRILSSSDGLWTMAPWKASKPDDVRLYGSNYELADTVAVFEPYFEFSKAAMPDVPLWNPHIMGGRPYLANAQSAIFSPFTLPAYVIPLDKALAVMAAIKLFVGAFGMFLLGRWLGMRFGGALLAGIVFAFGTFFVVWLPWPLTNVFPLIPFLLLLTDLVVRRPGPLIVAGLGGLVALQFAGGHPETSFHVMVVVVIWFCFRVVQRWWREGRDRRLLLVPAAAFAGALALGAAVAAVTLVPLLELLSESGDYERRLNTAPSFASDRWIGAFFLFDYWGRPTQAAIEPFVSNRGWYAGGITLMLAAAALILRPTSTRVAVAVFGVFAFTFTIGFGKIARTLVELPGFRTAHNGRVIIFVLLALALLAGWGLDDLSRRELPARWRRRLALAAVTAIFCVPFAWMLIAGTLDLGELRPALEMAWAFQDPPVVQTGPEAYALAPMVRLNALLQWLPLAGAALGLIALRLAVSRSSRWALPAGAFVALAVAVLVVDLFRANMGFNPAIPVENAEVPTTPALRYLQDQRPNRFTGVGDAGQFQPLGPDLAMRYGLYDARGYDYPVEGRFDKLWRATAGPGGDIIPPTTLALPTEASLRTLSLLSVADVMQDPVNDPLALPGLELAYDGEDARVYRNENALPRAFLVDRQRTVAGEDAALAAVTDPQFDPRREAITESEIEGVPTGGGGGSPGSARLTEYGREHAVVRASASRPALLVLTDVHYPGWKAWVDGEPADIERVDFLLRGVALGPGTHTVEFRYEPASWRVGWIVSLLGLLALGGLALLGWRRR
jgi:hypothetical protein